MLDQMRKQAQSAIVLLLFGFIIFVFVFSFGAGSVGFRSGGCGSNNAAAIVNGEAIQIADYKFVYRQQLQNMMAQKKQGQIIRKEDKLQLADQVLQRLVNQALLIQAARDLGLRVTDEERNANIRELPYFQDESKKFDFKRYKNIVQRYFQTSMAVFEEMHRQQMLAGRMVTIIQDTAQVTDEELKVAYRQRETKVNLEYVSLSPAFYKMGLKPSAEEVEAFQKANEDKIAKYYEDHESKYNQPKKVEVAHVFFEVEKDWTEDRVTDKKERAELTLEDLQKGADFANQAKEYSEDTKTREKGGDLGAMTIETMSARWGAPFAEAADKLEVGKFSEVVRSDKGFHVIKCLKILPAVEKTLEQVKPSIARQMLIDEQATAKVDSEAKRLLAGVREGKTLEELTKPKEAPAPAEEGKPKTIDPAAFIQARKTGPVALMAGYIPQLGLDRDIARAAFELTEKNPVPDKVWKVDSPMGGGQSDVVFRLVERIEPDMTKFEEAKEPLRRQLLASRRNAQLMSWLERKKEESSIEVNSALLSNANPLNATQARNR